MAAIALPQVPYWIFVAFDMSPRRLMWFVGAPVGWKINVGLGGSMSLTRRAALASTMSSGKVFRTKRDRRPK
jgi:hypothetical protein